MFIYHNQYSFITKVCDGFRRNLAWHIYKRDSCFCHALITDKMAVQKVVLEI